MQIKPVNGQVVATMLEADDKTPGGIIIPHQAQGAIQKGKVVAVGPGEWQRGKRRKPMVRVDDIIVWREKARNGAPVGNTIEIEGQRYFVMDEADILCVIGQDDEYDSRFAED